MADTAWVEKVITEIYKRPTSEQRTLVKMGRLIESWYDGDWIGHKSVANVELSASKAAFTVATSNKEYKDLIKCLLFLRSMGVPTDTKPKLYRGIATQYPLSKVALLQKKLGEKAKIKTKVAIKSLQSWTEDYRVAYRFVGYAWDRDKSSKVGLVLEVPADKKFVLFSQASISFLKKSCKALTKYGVYSKLQDKYMDVKGVAIEDILHALLRLWEFNTMSHWDVEQEVILYRKPEMPAIIKYILVDKERIRKQKLDTIPSTRKGLGKDTKYKSHHNVEKRT